MKLLMVLLSLAAVAMSIKWKIDETAERVIPDKATWYYTSPYGYKIKYTAITNPTLTLNDAKIYCEALTPGTTLASVISIYELNFLQAKLKLFVQGLPTRANRAAFWVAGTDLIINSPRGQGQYWFYNGRPINTTFWNVGEPNDFETGPNRVPETCIDLKVPASDPTAPFGINDEVCTTQISFICQIHPKTA